MKSTTRTGLSARYRAAVASRALAAIGGAYLLAALCAAASASWLEAGGTPRPEAVIAAAMIGFVVQAVAAIAVFAARDTLRAWLVVGVPSGLLALALAIPGAGS